jgi:hypothetical protein
MAWISIGLWGVAMVACSVVDTDALILGTLGNLHDLIVRAGFVLLVAGILLVACARSPCRVKVSLQRISRPWAAASIAVLTLAARAQQEAWFGLAERLLALCVVSWLIAVGLRLFRGPRPETDLTGTKGKRAVWDGGSKQSEAQERVLDADPERVPEPRGLHRPGRRKADRQTGPGVTENNIRYACHPCPDLRRPALPRQGPGQLDQDPGAMSPKAGLRARQGSSQTRKRWPARSSLSAGGGPKPYQPPEASLPDVPAAPVGFTNERAIPCARSPWFDENATSVRGQRPQISRPATAGSLPAYGTTYQEDLRVLI